MMFDEIECTRKRLGLSAWDLCKKANVQPTSYSQWRTGKVNPRQSSLKKLTDAICEIRKERETVQ
ncbi:helix-turn-helix domain-containing protein [Stappia stellulata]|uniref:helix-turn-helix domain-containing protein n=1 Tax=Stappia stellulata TaxID=71235 RepID=UPI001CD46C5B|nr:helix-turn-helix domain-containing protein [Stappia stellulata]MCA1241846.1 helix-turn-helix domain-containing protein [Stappia stellulata]